MTINYPSCFLICPWPEDKKGHSADTEPDRVQGKLEMSNSLQNVEFYLHFNFFKDSYVLTQFINNPCILSLISGVFFFYILNCLSGTGPRSWNPSVIVQFSCCFQLLQVENMNSVYLLCNGGHLIICDNRSVKTGQWSSAPVMRASGGQKDKPIICQVISCFLCLRCRLSVSAWAASRRVFVPVCFQNLWSSWHQTPCRHLCLDRHKKVNSNDTSVF